MRKFAGSNSLKSVLRSIWSDINKKADKSEIPTSLPANGGNADTLQGKSLSGNGGPGVVSVGGDGVTEIGTHLDFHRGDDGDYTVRLVAEADGTLYMAHNSGTPGGHIGCDVDTVGGYNATQLTQSNPNLLDNSDFRINQRGQTEYSSTTEIQSVDRWKTTGKIKVLDDGGIEWTHYGSVYWDNGGRYCDIIQHREPDGLWEDGELATLSACINDQVYSVSGTGSFAKTFDVDGHQLELIAWNGPTYRLRSYGEDDYTITVKWMKLEKGSVATPFVAPHPATELLKCRRYFEKGTARNITAMVGSDRKHASIYFLRAPKRVSPTVTVANLLHNGAAMDITTNITVHDDGNGSYGIHVFTDHDAFETDDFTYSFEYEASAEFP